jgi:hypothetical protein
VAGPASPRRSFSEWLRDGYHRVLLWRDRLPFVWRTFALAVISVGAILLWWELDPDEVPRGMARTSAEVVEVIAHTDRDAQGFLRRRYTLVLEYQDAAGQAYRWRSPLDARHHGTRPGDRVALVHGVRDPTIVDFAPSQQPVLVARGALALGWLVIAGFLIWPVFTGRAS